MDMAMIGPVSPWPSNSAGVLRWKSIRLTVTSRPAVEQRGPCRRRQIAGCGRSDENGAGERIGASVAEGREIVSGVNPVSIPLEDADHLFMPFGGGGVEGGSTGFVGQRGFGALGQKLLDDGGMAFRRRQKKSAASQAILEVHFGILTQEERNDLVMSVERGEHEAGGAVDALIIQVSALGDQHLDDI